MAQPATDPVMTPEAFLTWERDQSQRHLYFRGQIFGMAGGSPRHGVLASRVITQLGVALRGHSCDVHTSDLRLGLSDAHFVYADAVVVCRPLSLRPGTKDVVLNPRVVIEVLSKGTEAYDRGEKQAGYLALISVEHFVLVSQREPRVEVYSRDSDGSFRYRVYELGGTVNLDRIGASLVMDDLYSGVFELPGDEVTAEVV